MIAPTSSSYKRLQPASLSGYWQNRDGDRRNVTPRISAKGRLEHRAADASARPYTTVAALLQAALLGQAHAGDLSAMETAAGFEQAGATAGTASDLGGAGPISRRIPPFVKP